MASCPWKARLPSLGTIALGDASYLVIERHVEDCVECQSALEELARTWAGPTAVLPGAGRSPQIPGFEIRRELGRGAMGVVYLANQSGLDRPVALKILPGTIGTGALPAARRRWLREARAISSIRHANVVPLYDFGEADGWFFLVLEYIPGGTLKRRLTQPIRPHDAAGLVETIALAVGYIHGKGLLHLDLKPSNVLLDCEEDAPWDRVVPRVSDFGLALFEDPDGPEMSLAGPRGTPSYMAPEQASASSSGQLGPATDIYALGAILFEMFTGRPPFQGTSTFETLGQVCGNPPVPPRRLNPAIPRDLETICLKCLEKEPGRRYASAKDLAADLRRWLDGRPIAARPASSPEKAWRWCRRRPVIAALAFLLMLAISAGFLSTLVLWRYARAEQLRAEAERIRAEADLQVARAALAEILDLGQASIEPTVVITRDRVSASLQAARGRILDLAGRRPDDPAVWDLLAVVDLFLGRNLEYRGDLRQGEALYLESLAYWDKVLAKTPDARIPKYRRWQTLECLGRVSEQEGKPGESLGYWERAVVAGEALLSMMPNPDVNTMAVCRLALARAVDRRGDYERALAILEASIRTLSNPPPGARTAQITQRLAEARNELFLISLNSKGRDVKDWVARGGGALTLLLRAGGGATQQSEAGYHIQRLLSERVTSRRHDGKLDEARRVADQMQDFAEALIRAYPDQPSAHLASSLAFVQLAKNAWMIDDRIAIERNWKSALAGAHRALVLNPEDARARSEIAALQSRLRDLLR